MDVLRNVTILVLLLAFLAGPVVADDLYRVTISSQTDAEALRKTGIRPLLKLSDGYLVLDKEGGNSLANTNLRHRFVASGVTREGLALDISLDGRGSQGLAVVFDEDGVRIVRATPAEYERGQEYTGLAPIKTSRIPIVYEEPVQLALPMFERDVDLDSLIGLIDQDSLESFVYTLQDFPPRVTGSQADYDSRDWIQSKFIEFGYDSVYLDPFTYSSYNVHNIVAVKVGSTFPDHHIVVGGHKDAVSGSPGADDNGSGTAGIMEIARIMKDVPTNMTWVFICFDGEEQGLHGSWHYADEAAANGDSIVVMLNMDMIAYEGNTDDVKLYHGPDATYAELYQSIADSLPEIGLDGVLSGNIPYSDHYPFQQNGYDVVFTIEYNFSHVYHTYQDSTSYMDFDYMARIIKGQLATGYAIDGSYIPQPILSFDYPNGVPELVSPNAAETFQVTITGENGGSVAAGTEELHYSVNGAPFETTSLIDLGGDLYEGTLPALVCDDTYVDFYLSAEEASSSAEFYDINPANPHRAFVATSVDTIFSDDFEIDRGWTYSGGLWARGVPTGGGGQYGNPDPTGGTVGPNVMGYNLSGDYENSMPERHATSAAFDCSSISNVHLKFDRWLGVEQPTYDHAYIRVSTNGTTWTTVWENVEEITDAAWTFQDIDISSIADGESTVYVRFTMGTTDGGWRYCGWNIDNLHLIGFNCVPDTDTDGDGVLDYEDNCPLTYNPDQLNSDSDFLGDVCDNCPTVANQAQEDADGDAMGDECDECTDTDEDGYGDPGFPANTCLTDNCPDISNPDQLDSDSDGVGDPCDICPDDPDNHCCNPQWGNNAPTITSPSTVSVEPGELFEYTAVAEDQDCVDNDLLYTFESVPSWCTLVDQTVSGTAECEYTDTLFTVIVSDGSLDDTLVVTVDVDTENVPPQIEEIDEVVLMSGASYSYFPGITDPDDATHTVAYPNHPGWLSIVNDTLTGVAPGHFSSETIMTTVADYCSADTLSFLVTSVLCGDVDQSDAVDIDDIVLLIDYVFGSGEPPEYTECADVNCSGGADIDDIVYLIAYVFAGGQLPCVDCL